ncbi:putative RNA recognition motif domain, nucleotide-binding alpha-beta plait domain superfamily [Helianthus annuus]|nr:putative RNA recognition motif domain, nucleotide-binding alpha-beta plait domain superfamily [Helianthus annuus]KAJ0813440.1 putative RNA recognition motif domain, nucleotide-binding alpha-beta plait domain superfamily [Helianthus annuus]
MFNCVDWPVILKYYSGPDAVAPAPLCHFNIFVGDLSPEVTDAMLYTCFSVYSSCSDARVMWDQKTGRSRGFGFVSFRDQQDAQSAINDLMGKWLGSRQIRCNWGTKGAGIGDEKQASDSKSVVELTNGSSGEQYQNFMHTLPIKSYHLEYGKVRLIVIH